MYMAWFSDKLLWLPALFLGSALLVLLFPNGRLLSRSWRAVVWLAVGGSAITAFAHATSPGRISPYRISNPFGIERNPRSILHLLGDLGAATLLVCCVLAVISIFVRLQSAEGEERQQIKWFAYAAAVY
jgi:formate hydrogenlyase subunit 3/multisubunit Na+/H+ antiporter MnhD subunit